MVYGAYPIQTLLMEVRSRRALGTDAGSQALLAFFFENDFEKILQANAPYYPQYKELTSAVS